SACRIKVSESTLAGLTAMIAERPAADDGLERGREAVALRVQPPEHLVDQRLVGELHGAAQRIAQQLAAEVAAEFLLAPGLQIVLEAVQAIEASAVLQLGAGVHRPAAEVSPPEPADRVVRLHGEAQPVQA